MFKENKNSVSVELIRMEKLGNLDSGEGMSS